MYIFVSQLNLLFFRTTTIYTEKNIFCYQVGVVKLFWTQKRKLDAKYSTRACEMKSPTSSLLPPLNENRLCHYIYIYMKIDVFTLLNLSFLLQRKIEGR